MSLELIEGITSRKRRPNWTDQECLLLAQLMLEKKAVIRGKCNTGISTQDKRQAWEEITQTINTTFPQIQRTVSDCNKKWENLLAKSREEIKRQKRLVGSESITLEHFTAVTQIVVSVMNLSHLLKQAKDDLATSVTKFVESQQNSSDEDGNILKMDESFSNSFPLNSSASTSPAKENAAFTNIRKSLALQFSCGSKAPGELPATLCPTIPPSVQCPTLQERMDLEMSVLRRQDAVLKLQEEYYTLKIKKIKKEMEEPLSN